jgi:hypothetical protein
MPLSQTIQELVTSNRLSQQQAESLTYGASSALRDAGVRELITAGTLTMAQVLALTDFANYALCDAGVRELITAGTLTAEHIAAITTHAASVALRDAGTQQMLRNGQITIADILGPVHHQAHAVAAVPNINGDQSTHNASVHVSVSASASQLFDRYKKEIEGSGLESVISRVQGYVNSLPNDSQKNKAAKECVLRITDPHYTFTDPGSQITTRQLLALTFLATCDDDNRTGTLEDASKPFIEALYEIERGYNLSDTGVDQGGQNRPICPAGTFNKLIEKLQGIHPDCEIRFITRETASLKLPIVVREELMSYMSSLSNPDTAEDFLAFTRLMSQVKKDGVEVIWRHIEYNITDKMFDEFGSLYQDKADPSFTCLIDAGQYIELPDLSIFQEEVQNSKGYYQYCSQMLRRSGMFSSQEKWADYLSEHRHDSPKAQGHYDEQFGLVLRE